MPQGDIGLTFLKLLLYRKFTFLFLGFFYVCSPPFIYSSHNVVINNLSLTDWRSAVIFPLYKGKGERTECKNYRGISLLSVVRKIYAGILVDRVCRVAGGLIDNEQGVV